MLSPSRIAAVVLAAGMSRRMGRPKALLPLGGLPLIARVVEPIRSARVEPIVACVAIDRRLTTCNGRGVLMSFKSGK